MTAGRPPADRAKGGPILIALATRSPMRPGDKARVNWVSARPPTSAEAREFGIKRGSPITVARSRRFAADDSVIEYAELISRADSRVTYRYQYVPAETA